MAPWSDVMKKWGAGQLHSGGPSGPTVKNQKQAEAILESEKRKASEGKTEYQDHPARGSFGRRKG